MVERMSLSSRRSAFLVLMGLYSLTPSVFAFLLRVLLSSSGPPPWPGVPSWLSVGIALTAVVVIPVVLLVLAGYVAALADLPGGIWSVLGSFLVARLLAGLLFAAVGPWPGSLEYLVRDALSTLSLSRLVAPALALIVVFVVQRWAVTRRAATPRPLA